MDTLETRRAYQLLGDVRSKTDDVDGTDGRPGDKEMLV